MDRHIYNPVPFFLCVGTNAPSSTLFCQEEAQRTMSSRNDKISLDVSDVFVLVGNRVFLGGRWALRRHSIHECGRMQNANIANTLVVSGSRHEGRDILPDLA